MRTRLSVAGLLWAGLLLTAFDAWAAAGILAHARVQDDFRLVYLAGRLVLSRGWPALYDFAAQRAQAVALGFSWQPFVSPPPLALLGLPLAALPFEVAAGAWTVLLLAALAAGWWLVAPGAGLERWMHLALALGLFPVAFAVAIGQPAPLVLLAVAAAWWLLRRGREGWAGLCVAALVLKPQLAFLVPLALLVAGRRRAGLTALGVAAAAALASAGLLSARGISDYLAGLSDASTWALTKRFTFSDLMPAPAADALGLVTVGVALFAAWRSRSQGPELPLAAGLVGSTLATPYVGLQDFALLVLAGWLILRTRPAAWLTALLGLGYVLLELALLEGSLPLVLWRTALLVALAAQPYRQAGQAEAEGGGHQRLVQQRVGRGADR